MPLTVALHCSMVKKPQLVPPATLPEYWAHHRVLSQGRAVAGVCVSTAGTMTKHQTWFRERIRRPSHCYWNNTVRTCSDSSPDSAANATASHAEATAGGPFWPINSPVARSRLRMWFANHFAKTICKPIPRHNSSCSKPPSAMGAAFFKSRPCRLQ